MPIKKAKKDPRIQHLIQKMDPRLTLRYHRADGPNWGVNVVGNIAHIYFDKTKNPSGSLAHELLHILVQQRGYRRLRVGFSRFDQAARFGNLLTCLDNELQHHKMYHEFTDLGFGATEFYSDDDAGIADHLEKAFSLESTDILDVLPNYLSLIAPGGGISENQRQALMESANRLNEGRFAEQLRRIGLIFNSWANSETYDAQPILRSIFLTLRNPSFTWIGYSDTERPPNHGFFIDEPFEVDESESV